MSRGERTEAFNANLICNRASLLVVIKERKNSGSLLQIKRAQAGAPELTAGELSPDMDVVNRWCGTCGAAQPHEAPQDADSATNSADYQFDKRWVFVLIHSNTDTCAFENAGIIKWDEGQKRDVILFWEFPVSRNGLDFIGLRSFTIERKYGEESSG